MDFEDLGAVSLNVVNAERLIIGILEDSPDTIALAVGLPPGNGKRPEYFLIECDPSRARQIAASLLNKADSVDGIR